MIDEWRDVVGFEDAYQVSAYGQIKAKQKITWNGKCDATRKEKILKLYKQKNGYMMINLKRNGKIKHALIHRIVADAWIPNTTNKPTVNHIDGDKANNTVSNLEWCTHSEQNIHASKLGLKKFTGENHSRHKLKESQVIMIRYLNQNGLKINHNDYGVSKITIKDVINRKSWKHI